MRFYAAVASAIGWFALTLQLYLIIVVNDAAGVPAHEAVIRFFSYFTILTNILAALVLSAVAYNFPADNFFQRPSVQTAIASYITIVGIIYVTILRHLWAPEGPQWLADSTLHYAMPAIYVVFWFLFVRKGTLGWSAAITWLLFPLVYVIYALGRGALSGFYPYPFIDVSALGYAAVLKNSAGMFALFLVMGLIYIALGRALAKYGPAAR